MSPSFVTMIAMAALRFVGYQAEETLVARGRVKTAPELVDSSKSTHIHRGLRARRGRFPRHLAPSRAWHVGRARGAW